MINKESSSFAFELRRLEADIETSKNYDLTSSCSTLILCVWQNWVSMVISRFGAAQHLLEHRPYLYPLF